MGTTKLQLYKRAIELCEQTPISSLTDNVTTRHRCDIHYDDVLQWMMEQAFWNCAMRTLEITQNTAVSPAFGFEYAHDKPTDFIRKYVISGSEFLKPPLDEQDNANAYLIESGYIWASITPIYLRYVSNDSAYGYNLGNWTEGMAKAAAHELAARIATTVTGSSEKAKDLHEEAYMLAGKAATYDAMQQPTQVVREGRWTKNRFDKGRSSNYQRV
jgi:hypothetical protein